MAGRDAILDVLRRVVSPADDDEVLVTPRHEQPVVDDECQIARAKEGPPAIGGLRLEGKGRLDLLLPVANAHGAALEPDLADRAGRALHSSVGVDNGEARSKPGMPAADQRMGTRGVRLRYRVTLLELLSGETFDDRRLRANRPR